MMTIKDKARILSMALPGCALAAGPAFSGDAAKTIKNSVGIEMVLIPAGSFKMGRDPNFEDGSGDETPQHSVKISRPFYMGKTEVTQEQWVRVMGTNPSVFKGRTNPVENVSWEDVQTFIARLNEKEGTKAYRLPTEAEWEYAARAGGTGKYCFGDDEGELGAYAWYDDNSGEKTHPVGQLKANTWGLYDVHGNVWEWTQDWYSDSYYASSPGTDPVGPTSGSDRVWRGGSWDDSAYRARAASRSSNTPGVRSYYLGFRLSRSIP